MEDRPYDAVIVGGGPAGATCALYTARAKLQTIVLDRSVSGGALARTSRIANYPGLRGEIPGIYLTETIRKQAEDFGAIFVRTRAIAVDFEVEPRIVYTPEAAYAGRAVVIATGAIGRKERIPGEEKFLGSGVSYCATCDAPFFTDRDVAVVGDTDTALEETILLTRFARRVHLISPSTQLRAWRELVETAEANPKIIIYYGAALREIRGADMVSEIEVSDSSGEVFQIPVEGVFILLTGAAPTTDFLSGAVPLTADGCVAVDDEKATPVPGVYAIGDVICPYIKQAVIAVADGVIAALSVDRYLNKRERIRLDYR